MPHQPVHLHGADVINCGSQRKIVERRGKAYVTVLWRRGMVYSVVKRLPLACHCCAAFSIDRINRGSRTLLKVFLTLHRLALPLCDKCGRIRPLIWKYHLELDRFCSAVHMDVIYVRQWIYNNIYIQLMLGNFGGGRQGG